MCGPEILLAAALTGGSSYISNREARKNANRAKNAVNYEFQQEQDRQKKYREQSKAEFEKALSAFEPEKQQESIADYVGLRSKEYDDNSSTAAKAVADFGTLPANAPRVVKSDIAEKVADAVAEGKGKAKNLARLRSFSDTLSDNAFTLKQGALDIGNINDFSKNSAALNPAEQKEAARKSQKYTGANTLADIMGLAGQAVGMHAATGGFGSGNTAATWKYVPSGDQLPWRRYTMGLDTGPAGAGIF